MVQFKTLVTTSFLLGDKGRPRCDSDTVCAPGFPFYRFNNSNRRGKMEWRPVENALLGQGFSEQTQQRCN